MIQDDLLNTYQLITEESLTLGAEVAQEEITYETTLAQLDPLDKGGRWLALGIKEIQELSFLPDVAKDGLSNFLHTLVMNPAQRCETTVHEQVLSI